MAIAEHEIAQQETTQSLTVRLTEAQDAILRQAVETKGQSLEEFVVSSLRQAAKAVIELRLAMPAFGSDPMDRIHAERHLQEEAEKQTADETETPVLFTSYDGITREVGALPADLGRATALANERTAGKIWGAAEEEASCHAMQKGI